MLIITPMCGWTLLLKSKPWKDLLKPQGFFIYINCFSILYFCWRKRKDKLLLIIPSDKSRTNIENITYSRLLIIGVTSTIGINETNKQMNLLHPHPTPWTVIYPKLNCTLDILKYHFSFFPMAPMGFLHIPSNKINNKINIRMSMSQMQKDTN